MFGLFFYNAILLILRHFQLSRFEWKDSSNQVYSEVEKYSHFCIEWSSKISFLIGVND